MKKNISNQKSPKRSAATQPRQTGRITIGMDLGDKTSRYCVLNSRGEVVEEAGCPTTKKGMAQTFGSRPHCRIAIEVGTHSPWVSRELKKHGHEVIVANARQVKLISQSSRERNRAVAEGMIDVASSSNLRISTAFSRCAI